MKKLSYIFITALTLIIVISSCQDQDDLHNVWLQDGERDFVGKVDSLKAFGGNERIEFQCYLADQRVKFLNVSWNDLGVEKEVRLAVPTHEIDEPFNIAINKTDGLGEGEFTFTLVSDDDNGTPSIPFRTIGRVFGPKYQQTLVNRLVTGFDIDDSGITLQFSSAISDDDQGIELTYNNGTEDVTLTFTTEELEEPIFLGTPDFSTPLSYVTVYQPLNSIDVFKTEPIIPTIEKQENIALGKPATASGTLNSTYTPDKAVDGIIGNNNSRWINARVVQPHWIEIDLQDNYPIERVVIYDDTPNSNFLLEVEVNGVWEELENVTGNTQKVFESIYQDINASKIRYSFENPDSQFIVRMFEFEVYSTVTIQ